MQFPLYTTIPPKSDFRPIFENWKQSGFRVTSINNPDEAETLRAAGVNVLEVESQDKRLKISEIMRAIASAGEPFAGFTNADCRFIRPIDAEAIKPIAKNSLILAERIDVNDAGDATTVLSKGFDAFFFDTAYLKAIPEESEYRIGTPWWDYWFPLIMRRAGAALKKFSCPILLHTAHELNWDYDAYVRGARELQAAFPDMQIIADNRPDEFSCFDELSRSNPVLPPGIDENIAALLSSVPSLIKDIRALQSEIITQQNENAILRQNNAILEQNNVALEQNNVALEQNNVALEQNNVALEQNNVTLEQNNVALEQNNVALKQHNAALLNSTSYWVTYPLRLASTITRRAIGRLRAIL